MRIFGFKKFQFEKTRPRRFQQNRFQARIREARAYHRAPKILPQARTDISLKSRSWHWIFILAGLAALCGAAVYYIFFTDFFLVRHVTLVDARQITAETVDGWFAEAQNTRYWGVAPKNNWLFLNRSNVEKILNARSSRILRVESKRFWPNRLRIKLEERIPVAIWQTGADYFYLSQDGVLTEQLPAGYATSTDSFLRVVDLSAKPAAAGDSLGVQKLLAFMAGLSAEWQASTHTSVSGLKIPGRASSDIFAASSQGWSVYFDLDSPVSRQLLSLKLILEKEIPAERMKDLAYVDLRLPTTAYYCYRNEPCAVLTTPGDAP